MKFFRKILGSWYDNSTVKMFVELIFIFLPLLLGIRTFIFGFYQVPSGSMETTLLVGERFFADKLSYWIRKPERGEIIAFDEPRYNYSKNYFVNLWQRYLSWNVSNWTKRVIGKPGDHVKGVVENGKTVIYLNGQKLDESAYVNKYPLIHVRTPAQSSFLSKSYWQDPYTEIDTGRSFDPNKPFDQQPFYKINTSRIIHEANGETKIDWPGTPKDEDIFEVKLRDNEYWVMGDNRLGSSDSRFWGVLDGKLIHGRLIYRIWSMDSEESWFILDLIKHPLTFWKKIRLSRCFQVVR